MVPLLCPWFNLVLGSPKPWGGAMWIYQGENQMWKISFNQYWVLNCLGLLGVEEYCPNLYSALMWRVLKGERKIVVRRMQCLLFSWSSSKTTWLIVFKCACHNKMSEGTIYWVLPNRYLLQVTMAMTSILNTIIPWLSHDRCRDVKLIAASITENVGQSISIIESSITVYLVLLIIYSIFSTVKELLSCKPQIFITTKDHPTSDAEKQIYLY